MKMKKNYFYIFIIFILTYFQKKFTFSLKIELSKIPSDDSDPNSIDDDTEFYPYLFQYSLASSDSNVSFIFDTESYISWEESPDKTCQSKKVNHRTLDGQEIIGCPENVSNLFKNQTQYTYIKVDDNTAKGYKGKIGLNYIKNQPIFSQYNFLKSLDLNQSEKFINFIQINNKNATMTFGNEDIEDTIKQESSRKCKCKIEDSFISHYAYWCCKISTFRSKNVDIYNTDENKSGKSIYAIFSISDEFIIAPIGSGEKIMEYYENLIVSIFGATCRNHTLNNIKTLNCTKFTYEELPDLSIVLEDEIGLLAIASDLFKVVGSNEVMFKIKVNYQKDKENFWFLGEPIIKNYNLLVNYSDDSSSTIIITPSNLNGFILIVITCVGGFLVLFIFLVIIYCISQKEKTDKEDRELFNYFDQTNKHKSKEKQKMEYRRFMNKKQKKYDEYISSFNSLEKGFLGDSIKEDIIAENENEGINNDLIESENININNQVGSNINFYNNNFFEGAINEGNMSQNEEGLLGGVKYELYGTSKEQDLGLNNFGEEEDD